MNLLNIFWTSRPYHTMGALRFGKLAAYLLRTRNGVRVICANGRHCAETLPLVVSHDRLPRPEIARSTDAGG